MAPHPPIPTPAPVPIIKPRPLVPPLRHALPAAATIDAVENRIHTAFQAEYTKPGMASKLNLARLLWSEAAQDADDAATRYVLLRDTRDLAVSCGDVELALDAVRALRAGYVVDAPAMEQATLGDAIRGLMASPNTVTTAAQARRASELALWAAERAVNAGDYPNAAQDAACAVQAATRSGSADILFGARARAQDLQIIANEYAAIRPAFDAIRAGQATTAVKLSVGRFLAFVVNRPELGLPILAECSDPLIRETAVKDLKSPDAPADQEALADAWMRIAKTQSGATRDAIQRRAQFWYEKAIAQLSGLARRAVEARLLEMRITRLTHGLAGAYFRGADFQCKVFDKVDNQLEWNWNGRPPDDALPGEYFSVRWTGMIRAPAPGNYKIVAAHDDGIRVWIDGRLIIDRWQLNTGRDTAQVNLTGGYQNLKIEYFQATGGSLCGLGWQPPKAQRITAIPSTVLFHDPIPPSPAGPIPPGPNDHGVITLDAAHAALHGDTFKYSQKGSDRGQDFIGNWKALTDWISWDLTAPAGYYNVSLFYGCDDHSAGSQWVLDCGTQRLTGTTQSTGRWEDHKSHSAGLIHLTGGDHVLRLRVSSQTGESIMDLNKIVLTPVK